MLTKFSPSVMFETPKKYFRYFFVSPKVRSKGHSRKSHRPDIFQARQAQATAIHRRLRITPSVSLARVNPAPKDVPADPAPKAKRRHGQQTRRRSPKPYVRPAPFVPRDTADLIEHGIRVLMNQKRVYSALSYTGAVMERALEAQEERIHILAERDARVEKMVADEKRKAEEEENRKAEKKRIKEERKRKAEEKRIKQEQMRLAEEKRIKEEEEKEEAQREAIREIHRQRLADEQRQLREAMRARAAEEAQKKEELLARQREEERLREEERRLKEAERLRWQEEIRRMQQDNEAEQIRIREAQEQAEKERAEREAREREARLQQLFTVYEGKWTQLKDAPETVSPFSAGALPWPLINPPRTFDDFNVDNIKEFLFHPLRPVPKGKSRRDLVRAELLRWHPDKFNARVLTKVIEAERDPVCEAAGMIVRIMNDITKEELPREQRGY